MNSFFEPERRFNGTVRIQGDRYIVRTFPADANAFYVTGLRIQKTLLAEEVGVPVGEGHQAAVRLLDPVLVLSDRFVIEVNSEAQFPAGNARRTVG